jgi:hypothetical protein
LLELTAKLPKEIVIGKDGPIENYLVLCSSHDGSMAITAFYTPVRVVCQNTLNAAFNNNTNRVYIKHTQNVKNFRSEEVKMKSIVLGGLSAQYTQKGV